MAPIEIYCPGKQEPITKIPSGETFEGVMYNGKKVILEGTETGFTIYEIGWLGRRHRSVSLVEGGVLSLASGVLKLTNGVKAKATKE